MDAPAYSFGQGELQVRGASKQPNPLLSLCHACKKLSYLHCWQHLQSVEPAVVAVAGAPWGKCTSRLSEARRHNQFA